MRISRWFFEGQSRGLRHRRSADWLSTKSTPFSLAMRFTSALERWGTAVRALALGVWLVSYGEVYMCVCVHRMVIFHTRCIREVTLSLSLSRRSLCCNAADQSISAFFLINIVCGLHLRPTLCALSLSSFFLSFCFVLLCALLCNPESQVQVCFGAGSASLLCVCAPRAVDLADLVPLMPPFDSLFAFQKQQNWSRGIAATAADSECFVANGTSCICVFSRRLNILAKLCQAR